MSRGFRLLFRIKFLKNADRAELFTRKQILLAADRPAHLLHSILAIVLIRVPGAYLMSRLFPQTLLPMGLATAAGSLFSAILCTLLYLGLTRRDKASR